MWADIVSVYGLTGNGMATWGKATVWPRDLLPKAVPAVGVITWNYDADVMRFFNKTGQNTILEHAKKSCWTWPAKDWRRMVSKR